MEAAENSPPSTQIVWPVMNERLRTREEHDCIADVFGLPDAAEAASSPPQVPA